MTPQLRELAKKFPKETEESIKNLVGLWQVKNDKTIEDIPTGSELNKFIQEIRAKDVQESLTNNVTSSISTEIYSGKWTRKQVSEQQDKVFLFGDNTDDRLNTKYVPRSTQAVIRGLPNAIGIDTKKRIQWYF